MAGNEFSREEQAFRSELGLDGQAVGNEALTLLVAHAEPLPPEVAERIRQASRAKAGVPGAGAVSAAGSETAGSETAGSETAGSETAGSETAAARPQVALARRRLLLAAAAVLLALGANLAVMNAEKAVAAVQRLFHLIPGFGVQETSREALVMASPVSMTVGGLPLTVTGLISDGDTTRVTIRIEGIPQQKVGPPGPSYDGSQAALVLPDGARLTQTGSYAWVGGDFKANMVFPALPPSTSSVTLHMPAITGVTDAFAVPIPLTHVTGAGLPEALPGSWAEEQRGVRIGAPEVAFRDNEIIVRMQGMTTEPKNQVSMIGTVGVGMERFAPTLTDDRGRTYQRNGAADVWDAPGDHSLVFVGPVGFGARHLMLRVPAVEVRQQADAILKIDLTRLPIGESMAIRKSVHLGPHTVVVSRATRETAERLRLDLELQPEVDGVQFLRFGMEPVERKTGSYSYGTMADEQTGQLVRLWFDTPADAGSYSVRLRDPIVRVRGPWLIELPAR